MSVPVRIRVREWLKVWAAMGEDQRLLIDWQSKAPVFIFVVFVFWIILDKFPIPRERLC